MISQIGLTGIWTADQDRALAFYVDKLGFEKVNDQTMGDYRWIEVAPRGAETGMTLSYAGPGSDQEGLIGAISMVLFSDDIQATHQQLSGNGVDFIEEPTQQPWGLQAQFKDPDGNHFVLVQRAGLRPAPQV